VRNYSNMAATTSPPPPSQPQEQSSYIDYPLLLSSSFSPVAHANSLLHATTAPNDTPPLDLSTPLSRLLFDTQDLDAEIHSLTTANAAPILTTTQRRTTAATRVLDGVETHVRALEESYARLEREVGERHRVAELTAQVAERLVRTLRLGRAVQRAVGLGRQIEGFVEAGEWVQAARTVVVWRGVWGEEGEALQGIKAAREVRDGVVAPAERVVLARAQATVREFSLSSLGTGTTATAGAGGGGEGREKTYAQTEDAKARATSALQTLYLLSPVPTSITKSSLSSSNNRGAFDPTLLTTALQAYLQTAQTASVASLTRALAALPTLDKTLLEISARGQNIIALENLLGHTPTPSHPLLPENSPTTTLLEYLLHALDTPTLPTYFWRSLASALPARVAEVLARGGAPARALRGGRDRVKEAIRRCVDQGTRGPGGKEGGNWEREAAVMVGAVVGAIK